jgi:hypothetical protein
MNYPEENSPDRNPRPADEVTDEFMEDRELKSLLCEWRAPEVTGSLDQRILTAYRRQFHARPWWRQWLTGSISLPVPVAAMAVLLLCATSYLAVRRVASYPPEVPPITAPVKIVEVPVPVVKEKIVTRVVYKNRGARKTKEGLAPISPATLSNLAKFRPVSKLEIIVTPGGNDEK